MKNIISVMVILMLALGVVTPAYCQGPVEKLVRGVTNVATCLFEVPYRINKGNKSGDAGYGLSKGILAMTYRLVVGIWETTTFLIPVPEKYEPMIKDPEFLFAKEK